MSSSIFVVKCPCKKEDGKLCGRIFTTKKKTDIQCRGCGNRFDLEEGKIK